MIGHPNLPDDLKMDNTRADQRQIVDVKRQHDMAEGRHSWGDRHHVPDNKRWREPQRRMSQALCILASPQRQTHGACQNEKKSAKSEILVAFVLSPAGRPRRQD